MSFLAEKKCVSALVVGAAAILRCFLRVLQDSRASGNLAIPILILIAIIAVSLACSVSRRRKHDGYEAECKRAPKFILSHDGSHRLNSAGKPITRDRVST